MLSACWREVSRRAGLLAGLCGILAGGIIVAARAGAPDLPGSDSVGIIDGEDIAVSGPMRVELVGGQVKTILRSGSDVRVKSGEAKISLVEGGQVSICGPAHFSVLKSGLALTIALESGVIHALLEQEPTLTIYTAQIQGQAVAIGDEPRDLVLGFENSGVMCIRTYRGALRLEQQLTGQNVMVPQGGDILLMNGQIDGLRNGEGHCKCELQMAKAPPAPPPLNIAPALSAEKVKSESAQGSNQNPRTATESAHASSNATVASEKSAGKDGPIYQVDMPPLVYDARAKVQPEPDPRLMMIVRRVHVRSELVFRGRVEEPAPTVAVTPPPPVVTTPVNPKPQPQTQESVVDRVRSFFRRLWSHSG